MPPYLKLGSLPRKRHIAHKHEPGYRNEGIYYEAVTNKILDDLVAVTKPRSLMLEGRFGVRGGISSVVSASYEKPGRKRG